VTYGKDLILLQGDEVEQEPSEERPIKRRKVDTAEQPNIIKLMVTPSQKHAVLVTGEDKCVRVFSISSEGVLEQLSQR
jgi:tRNA (guanine-N(7)-)-methyltransferase subunit TRM82